MPCQCKHGKIWVKQEGGSGPEYQVSCMDCQKIIRVANEVEFEAAYASGKLNPLTAWDESERSGEITTYTEIS
jgi:hypothetical protein